MKHPQSEHGHNLEQRLVSDPNDRRKEPLIGLELVWVQCKGYRCMAYPDAAGRWINFYTGRALTDFVEVLR